jgi:hypothetical protein
MHTYRQFSIANSQLTRALKRSCSILSLLFTVVVLYACLERSECVARGARVTLAPSAPDPEDASWDWLPAGSLWGSYAWCCSV